MKTFYKSSEAQRKASLKWYYANKDHSRKIPVRDHGPDRDCLGCMQRFPRTEEFFAPSATGRKGLNPRCRPCAKKMLQQQGREHRIRKEYGLTHAEYVEFCARTNGQCPICGRFEPLVLDHCHATKKLRMAICNSCNNGLGRFRDSSKTLRRAADYIDFFCQPT
jgi:hypothetical protein